MLALLYYFEKSSQRASGQHLPFQSLNGNTKVGCDRCSKFIKVTSKKLLVKSYESQLL